MFQPSRLLAPLCAGLMFLAGCGGGGDAAAPAGPSSPATPSAPPPASSAVTLAAQAGSATHATLSWSGGSAGTAWRLERRVGDAGAYAAVADVDASAGLWLDSGLSADTDYSYRLSRADGSVVASASARTGSEAVLTTAAPEPAGASVALPYTTATTRLATADGSLQLELPAGSFGQAGTATLQAASNPLPDGVGPGLTLTLPERPARTLTLSMRYGADESADDVTQDRIALRQADGSWWVLPLDAHDEGQRLLRVTLPPGLWPVQPAVAAMQARAKAAATGIHAEFVRVKAHKLVPAAATVRVLGSQRFVPVSIYAMRDIDCGTRPDDLCIPSPVLRDVTVPVLNAKPGFQREWTLEGSAAPAASLGALAAEAQAGVVYTAPAAVPATNPLTLRFRSVNSANGRRLVLTAKVRVAEDAWSGLLSAWVGELTAGHLYKVDTRWTLDPAQSTATRRVYRPTGTARHDYTVVDPVCTHKVSPQIVPLAEADTAGQLVVDESVSPARYTLALSTRWNSAITVTCPKGTVVAPTVGGHVWQAQGVVAGGRIEGSDGALGERTWTLGRPE